MHGLKVQRGQALVEFALILPILLVLIVGIVDFGAAYNQKNDLNFLANSAARFAEVNACGPCTGAQQIEDYVTGTADTSYLRDNTAISICLPKGTDGVGDPLQVTASAPYDWLGVLKGSGLPGGTITLSSTVTVRILHQPSQNGTTWYSAASSC